jgi:hypothetical protein
MFGRAAIRGLSVSLSNLAQSSTQLIGMRANLSHVSEGVGRMGRMKPLQRSGFLDDFERRRHSPLLKMRLEGVRVGTQSYLRSSFIFF